MKYIILNSKGKTKKEVLNEISKFAKKKGIVTNAEKLESALFERENQVSTGFEKGIAIPHAIMNEIKESVVIIARNSVGVDWPSLDQKPTNTMITLCIAGGKKAGNEHMDTLSKISSLLMEEKNIKIFKTGTIAKIKELVAAKTKEEKSAFVAEAKSNKYDFVAVTSCITGVAHTNMSAEAILKFARENNLNVKVERQGAQGSLTPITNEDVKNTKYVLLAIDKPIDGMDRFNGKMVLKTKTVETMRNMGKVYKELKTSSKLFKEAGSSSNSNKDVTSVGKPVSAMKAIMNGLSYMIPVVIVGGIFLAFGLGIGRIALHNYVNPDVTTHPGTVWYTVFQIGVAGINLAVVVLAGFIASALGGRMVIAPAMILAFVAQGIGQTGPNEMFFNYQTMQFGVPNSNLSFFGSVSAGLLCGYAGFYWNKFVSPKINVNIKTIEPIIIIPILFVLVGWILFAFALYLPLYYIAQGLGNANYGAIPWLVHHNLLWIVGAVGGAMLCADLGGPINKIAFGLGVVFITTDPKHPEVMGAIAAAGSVGPLGMALGWFIGKKIFRIKVFDDQLAKDSFVPAIFMGFLGISEGAIPFAIKYPRSSFISNILGGAVAGAISGALLITDNAAHTGPIVYILGAIGINGNTDYLYGLLYIMAIAAGSLFTAILFASQELFYQKIAAKKEARRLLVEKIQTENKKSEKAVEVTNTK